MELVGRDAARAATAAAWERARRGHGGVLLVSGEAGIGKTSVVRAAAEAVTAGATGVVRWAACWEGGEQPLQPWVDLLRWPEDEPPAEVAARLAVGGDDAASLGRSLQQLAAEVVGVLRRAAAATAQLLVIDDLQWADEPTLRLLRAVAAQSPAMGVLVLGTVRTGEAASGDLGDLGGLVEHLPLPPLSSTDVAGLLAGRLGRDASEHEVRSVHERSGGNPLFAVQLAHLLASGAPLGLPAPVRDVLARRFARLPSATMELLGAAAVLGARFDPRVLALLVDREPAAVLADLDPAATAGLMGPDPERPGGWAFGHALIVDARLDQLPSADRARLHGRALAALEAGGQTTAAVLAGHALLAELPDDDPTPARWSIAAGQEALARLDAADAAAHFERAIAASVPGAAGDGPRAEAWLGLGASHLRRGEEGDAGDAFVRAADLGGQLGDADLVGRAALGFGAGLAGFEVRMLEPRQGELLRRAADLLDDDAPLRPAVLARLSVASAYSTTPGEQLGLADEAVAAARHLGDRATVAAALAARCDALAGPDHVGARLVMATEVVDIGTAIGDLQTELLGRRLRAVAHAERLDLGAFDREVDAFELASARLGDPLYHWYVDLWRGARAVGRGEAEVARDHQRAAERTGELAGSANAQILTAVLDVFIDVALEGDIGYTRSPLFEDVELERLGLANAAPMTLFARHLRGVPGVRDAVADLLRGLDDMTVDAEWLPAMVPLVELLAPLDLTRHARDVYDRLAPYAELGAVEGIVAAIRGPMHRWLAIAASDAGEERLALEHADAAIASAAAIGALCESQTRDAVADTLTRLGTDRALALADRLNPPRSDGSRSRMESIAAVRTRGVEGSGASLVREGDHWAVTFDGRTVRIKHAKGVADLAVLLAARREVHVRELGGAADQPVEGGGAPVLDERAVAEYRARLIAIEEDLDEADRNHDLVRSARLATERDALVDELTGAFGLGGRARRLGATADERLRKAVSGRLKASIDRLGELHPSLGRHLTVAVRTGTWCRYQPESSTEWRVEP